MGSAYIGPRHCSDLAVSSFSSVNLTFDSASAKVSVRYRGVRCSDADTTAPPCVSPWCVRGSVANRKAGPESWPPLSVSQRSERILLWTRCALVPTHSIASVTFAIQLAIKLDCVHFVAPLPYHACTRSQTRRLPCSDCRCQRVLL